MPLASTVGTPIGDVKLDGAGDVSVDASGGVRGNARVVATTTIGQTQVATGGGVSVGGAGVSGDLSGRAAWGAGGKSTAVDGSVKMDSGGVRADANLRWERGVDGGSAGVQATTERVAATGTIKTGASGTQLDGSLGIERGSLDATARARGAMGELGGRISFARGKRDASGDATTMVTVGSFQGRALVRGRVGRATAAKDLGAHPSNDGRRVVELEKTTVGEAGVGLGVLVAGAVLGGGGDGRRTHRVTWRTARGAEEAGALVADPTRIEVPSLVRPDAIPVGDAVTVATEGELSVFIEAGVLGATVAGRASLAAELSICVERTSEALVRISVAPTNVRRVSVDGRAVVLTVSLSDVELKGLTHTFDLDLSTRAGREAYAAALCGRLPGPDELPTSAVTLVDDVNASLPEGVRAVALSEEHVRTHALSGSLAYLLVGMTLEYDRTSEERRTAESGRVTLRRGSSHGTTRKSLLSGTAQARVSGEVVTVEDAAGTHVKGVSLVARFVDDWMQPRELARITAALRDTTGQSLPAFSGVPGEKREIELEVVADAATLAALTVDGAVIADACLAASLTADDARALEVAMRRTDDVGRRAEALVDFVQRHGLRGVGAIARAWPQLPVALRGRTDAYARALADAEAIVDVFEGPVAPDAYLFFNRASQIAPVLQALNDALDALEVDPFFIDDGDVLHGRLSALCAALADLVDLSHVGTGQLQELFFAIQGCGLAHPGHAFGLALAELQKRR